MFFGRLHLALGEALLELVHLRLSMCGCADWHGVTADDPDGGETDEKCCLFKCCCVELLPGNDLHILYTLCNES